MKTTLPLTLLSSILLFALGCATDYPRLTEPNAAYLAALEKTDPEQGFRPANEDAALQGVIDLFEDFSHDNVQANTRKVYADRLFFRDGFKAFDSLEDLEPYMVESTEPLELCRFIFSEPVRDHGDYYLRWTMEVRMKGDPEDHVDRVIGFSHIRFNKEGKVVFQQDYWDPTDVLYRRIPIANGLIGYVRSKL